MHIGHEVAFHVRGPIEIGVGSEQLDKVLIPFTSFGGKRLRVPCSDRICSGAH